MTDPSIREQFTMCVDCGALILRASVRLSSGTLVTISVESPDAPIGPEEALRVALDEGTQWVVNDEGAWVEHSLDRCNAVAAQS